MLVQVTRTASALTARVLFYGALFLFVVVAHSALTTVLRQQGWSAGAAVTTSGAVVLAVVLAQVFAVDWARGRMREWRENQRLRHNLPVGPCCVVWREVTSDEVMPWKTVGPVRARFPPLARRLGVEGLAVVEFEVGADGRAKNFACVDAWPSDMFYTAARDALMHARFQPRHDEHMRFGASYRMPFIFRIAGASRVSERGQRARRLRAAQNWSSRS